MFIGHFGIGLGAKRVVPKISLGTLFLAAQFLDLLWPTFLLLGWEHVIIDPGNTEMTPLNFIDYPLTHSFLMAMFWGGIFGIVYFLIKRNLYGSVILGLCVVSHWFLDLLVHRPDLQLYPGGTLFVGLGLWNLKFAAIILESAIFIAGVWLYLKSTTTKNKTGYIGFWALILFLVIIHLGNIFGPPPPNTIAIAWVGQLQWIIVIWGYWVDYYRQPTVQQ